MKLSSVSVNNQPLAYSKLLNRNKKHNTNFRSVDIKIGANGIRDLKKADKLFVLAHPDDETCFFGFLIKLN